MWNKQATIISTFLEKIKSYFNINVAESGPVLAKMHVFVKIGLSI